MCGIHSKRTGTRTGSIAKQTNKQATNQRMMSFAHGNVIRLSSVSDQTRDRHRTSSKKDG